MEAHVPKAERAYIAGAGASGAVLAGAAIVFISVVGLVSSTEWPDSDHRIEPVNSSLDPVLRQGPLGVPAVSPVAATAAPAPAVAAPPSPAREVSAVRRQDKRRGSHKAEGNGGSNVAIVSPEAASRAGAGTSNLGRSRNRGGTSATARSGDQSSGSSGGSSIIRRRSEKGSSSTRGSGSRGNGHGKGGHGKGKRRANGLGGDKGHANGLGRSRR